MTTLFSYGIIPDDGSADKAFCGDPTKSSAVNSCSIYLKSTEFAKDFNNNCLNKESCTTTMTLRNYVDFTVEPTGSSCTNDYSLFYL